MSRPRPTRRAFLIQSQTLTDGELNAKITASLYMLKPLELIKIYWIRDTEGVIVYLRSRKQMAITTPRNVGWKGFVESAFKDYNIKIVDDEVIALSSKFEALMKKMECPLVEFKVSSKVNSYQITANNITFRRWSSKTTHGSLRRSHRSWLCQHCSSTTPLRNRRQSVCASRTRRSS